ncbi:hypothetical protein AVEN_204975-1 [Araneus ventricosus]|uniref:Uncharacterized protein n=1 Tax=Araneus ventricosus TaxID=182803 RepID=A0A4Y2S498_ARAVE|nr:hypothetical protein AVEN_204975-1 [Araneus ventricosus]
MELTSLQEKVKMGAEGPHAYHKSARMVISLKGFCSWTIMQDSTQQGTQKNSFVAGDGRDKITRPTDPILHHQTFTFSCIELSTIRALLPKQ